MIKGVNMADFAVLVVSAKKSDDTDAYRSEIYE
jgi:translation elongation factor EF-1alpha